MEPPNFFLSFYGQDRRHLVHLWRTAFLKASKLSKQELLFGNETVPLYGFHLFVQSLFTTRIFSLKKQKRVLNLMLTSYYGIKDVDLPKLCKRYIQLQWFLQFLKHKMKRFTVPTTMYMLFFHITKEMMSPEIQLLQKRVKEFMMLWKIKSCFLQRCIYLYNHALYCCALKKSEMSLTCQVMGTNVYLHLLNRTGLYGCLFLYQLMPSHPILSQKLKEMKESVQTLSHWEKILTDDQNHCLLTHPLLPHPFHFVWTLDHSGTFADVVRHFSIEQQAVRFDNEAGCRHSKPMLPHPVDTVIKTYPQSTPPSTFLSSVRKDYLFYEWMIPQISISKKKKNPHPSNEKKRILQSERERRKKTLTQIKRKARMKKMHRR